jgi:hypothetical protein
MTILPIVPIRTSLHVPLLHLENGLHGPGRLLPYGKSAANQAECGNPRNLTGDPTARRHGTSAVAVGLERAKSARQNGVLQFWAAT